MPSRAAIARMPYIPAMDHLITSSRPLVQGEDTWDNYLADLITKVRDGTRVATKVKSQAQASKHFEKVIADHLHRSLQRAEANPRALCALPHLYRIHADHLPLTDANYAIGVVPTAQLTELGFLTRWGVEIVNRDTGNLVDPEGYAFILLVAVITSAYTTEPQHPSL